MTDIGRGHRIQRLAGLRRITMVNSSSRATGRENADELCTTITGITTGIATIGNTTEIGTGTRSLATCYFVRSLSCLRGMVARPKFTRNVGPGVGGESDTRGCCAATSMESRL
jgi:hypothetical protein